MMDSDSDSDLSELDILFLPSRWSKRLPSDQIVGKHVEIATKNSEKARNEIPSKRNIPYGTLNKEKIDIFGTDLSDDAPVFAFVHGGYWQEECLTRDTYHFIATNLYKHGIKSIFIGYELCPNVSLPEIIKEIERAVVKCVEYCQEHDSRGLYLAGYSAGCQLVAVLFTSFIAQLPAKADIIKAAILIAGIYDLTQLPTTSINLPLKLDASKALGLSPLHRKLETCGAKFLVVAAENDSPEFTKQSRAFHQKLIGLGMSSNLNVIKDVDHFDIVELLTNEDFEVFSCSYLASNKLIISSSVAFSASVMSELDIAYLPNRWSKRLPPNLVIEKHVAMTSKASQEVRVKIPCKLDIPYGTMKNEKIDFFGTDLQEDAPTVIFIHGGYWCDRTIKRESYGFIAENLYKNKIKTYLIGYELCPSVEMSWILKEIETATQKCIQMAKNTRGIFIVGHSVGAHLAATLFINLFKSLSKDKQKQIKATILISGLYDLVPISETIINIPLKLNKLTAREASPLHQDITGNGMEFFIFLAEFDGPGFIKQSKEFYDKLKKLNVKCNLETIANTDHFDCVELLFQPDYKLSIRILEIIKKSI